MYTKDGKLLMKEEAESMYNLMLKAKSIRGLSEMVPHIDRPNGDKAVVTWQCGGNKVERWESVSVEIINFDRLTTAEELYDSTDEFAKAYGLPVAE